MKQMLFLLIVTALGCVGAVIHPFWGVMLYYGLASLRPQHLWDWALPVEIRWSLLAACALLLATGIHGTRLFVRASINPTMLLMLGYGVLVLASMITAFDPALAQHWAVEYGKVLLIATIAMLVIDRLWQVRWLGLTILLCVGYIAYEINFLYVFQNYRLDVYHTGYGGLDNNGAGLMLAMAVPLACGYATARIGRFAPVWRVAAVVLGLCLIHAVMLTYSRGAMVAMLAGLLWLLLWHKPRWQALGLGIVLTAVVLVGAGNEVRERFTSTADFETDGAAQSRLSSWSAAWQIAWEAPLLGTGIRNSSYFGHNYGTEFSGRTIHNQYLQVAADSGVPAALLYTGMLGAAFMGFHRARRRCERVYARRDASAEDADEARATAAIFIACQSSMLVFVTGAMFLSLEIFELPWVLTVMGGVAPRLVARRFEPVPEAAGDTASPAPAAPRAAAKPHPNPIYTTQRPAGL